MTHPPIALQLYSVRNELAEDVAGTLRAVAQMGYEGVEFAGAPQHSAAELRSLLDETGLVPCGWHTPFALVQDDTLDDTIAFNQELGNRNIIIPSIPAEIRQSRADWLELAAFFDELAQKLAPHDMRTGYHNHHVEFTLLDGEMPWDTFFSNTLPAVIMQLDNGNALLGGGDPVSIIRTYPGRAVTVHLKPYTFIEDADDPHAALRPIIGEDDVPWETFFDACESVGGTEWYIVEYESDAYPPLEAVDRCLQALRAMGQ